MPIPAQASQIIPPLDIASWLACAFFMIAIFNSAAKAWFTLRGKPSPIESMKATSDIESRVGKIEDCVKSCRENQNRRIEAIEREQKELGKKIASEIDKVFKRVNTVADLSSTMNGELSIIKAQLAILLTTSRGEK